MNTIRNKNTADIPWVSSLPREWHIVRLKNICTLNYGDSLSDEKRMDGEVPVYGSNGIVGRHNVAITTSPCIIIGRKGSYGKVNYSTEPCFPIDTTYWIDTYSTSTDLRWLSYLLPLLELDINSQDSAVPGLSREVAYEKRLPLPPHYEQHRIAAYLDEQTAKIDRLINLRQRQMALLKEQRTALIQQAVTHGLNPNVPMKDSGLPWLGEIPVHWKIKRLKFVSKITTGSKDTVNANEFGDFPFFVRSQVVERINSYSFDGEAVLTAGDGVGVGKVFHYYEGKFDFHQRVYMLFDFKNVLGRFLFYYLRENFYKVALEGGAKSTVDSLRMPVFMNFGTIIPPSDEQRSIIEYIDKQNGKFAALTDTYSRQLTLLAEYRAALIHECVTGQRAVPDDFNPGDH